MVGEVNLATVMDEVAALLEQVTGLRVYPYPPPSINAPAGYVSYPRSIDYDQTYGRGTDQYTDLPIVLLAGKATDRSARDTVAGWCAGSGPDSIKQLLEEHKWVGCDDLTIATCEFDVELLAGIPYLQAMFKATIEGPGKEET